MLVDSAEIYVRAGRGGDGCRSFRREKFVPKGGPDGGDGGKGGDVYLRAAPNVDTLLDFSGRHHWIAPNGQHGSGKDCTGRSAEDLTVDVPTGTLVYDRETGVLLIDLVEPGAAVCIAQGGKGGRGNKRFATATNQAPQAAEPGEPGQERWLRLELKLIADVGIIGLPNAGKSTLLSRLSHARPKIASYPFTTLQPNLGIMELSDGRRLVLADIPGLIEGAHDGAGLGDAFLRHIERTRVLLHLVDVSGLDGGPAPVEAYAIVRGELEAYSASLAEKPELVVAGKMDLVSDDERRITFEAALGRPVPGISAVTGAGLNDLRERLWRLVEGRSGQ